VVRTVSINGDVVPLTENIAKDAKTLASYDDDELETLEQMEDEYVEEVLASPEFIAERRSLERSSSQNGTPSYFPSSATRRSLSKSPVKPLDEVVLTGNIREDAKSLASYPRESVEAYADQDTYVEKVLDSPEYRSEKRLLSQPSSRSPSSSPTRSALRSATAPKSENGRRHVRFNCVAETPLEKWRDL
jgi:hypothetical protein